MTLQPLKKTNRLLLLSPKENKKSLPKLVFRQEWLKGSSKKYSTDIPLWQFLGEQYQSSFYCSPVDNQYQILLKLLVILTALKMPVWLTVTNLNKTDSQYSLFV